MRRNDPWPWRVRYSRALDCANTERWTWDWFVWPCILVLDAIRHVWPHDHLWYSEPGWRHRRCVYCNRTVTVVAPRSAT